MYSDEVLIFINPYEIHCQSAVKVSDNSVSLLEFQKCLRTIILLCYTYTIDCSIMNTSIIALFWQGFQCRYVLYSPRLYPQIMHCRLRECIKLKYVKLMALCPWNGNSNLLFVLVIDACSTQRHTVRDNWDASHFDLHYSFLYIFKLASNMLNDLKDFSTKA